MEILNLLEKLEDELETGFTIPLTSTAIVNREEILEIIRDIRLKLPEEIKQAKWVKEERQRILIEAQKEAAEIVKEAENRIISMIDTNEITRKSYEQANDMVISAERKCKEIRQGALEYADDVLLGIEETLKSTYMELHKNRQELKR